MNKPNICYSYFASPIEGQLYEVNTEDGIGITFDCGVVVLLAGGETLVHKTFHTSGKGYDDEVGTFVRHSRQHALDFCAKVNARGWIDLAHWEPLPERDSLEERWAGYAREDAVERAGYFVR